MRTIKFFVLTAAVALAAAVSAQAAPVTVGSPLAAPMEKGVNGGPLGTYLNLGFNEPGALPTSPVTGAVIRWSVAEASGPFKLRILRPAGGTSYTAVGSSPLVNAVGGFGTGVQTFPVTLPIQAGDTVGLDIAEGNDIGIHVGNPSDVAAIWVPPISDGSTAPYLGSESKIEVGFNAVVQPAPTLAGISPASGSIKGGTTVTVTGTDFAGVSGVSFGGVPATSLAVSNEGQLTAVAPPAAKTGPVDVTVTTVAGTTPITIADQFTYKACTVPNLRGKKLKAAKKKLRKAGCKLGKVTKKKGVTAKTGKVVKQKPKSGKVLAPGSKVKVTLG